MNGDKEKSGPGIPEETKAIPEVPKPVELTDDALASVAGGGGDLNSVLSNVSKTRHEISKGIVQNIRG